MQRKKKTKQDSQITKLKLHTEFEFMFEKNADNVALALVKSGYYIKIYFDSSRWILRVYTDRI